MSIIACIIEGCDRPKKTREWCHKHYEYLRSRGELPPKLCLGCDKLVGKGKRYHDTCIPSCSVEGCADSAKARGWCIFHYTRWKLAGDPTVMHGKRFYEAGQVCSFRGCDNPARKVGLCNSHYSQKLSGNPLRQIVPKSGSLICAFCGGPSGIVKGMRKYCSVNCQQMYYRHGGPLPEHWACSLCKQDFPYVVEGRRRIKADVISCNPCRLNASKHGYSAGQLAHRDGTDCRICGESVDMSLSHPDLMRGSVDHILPRSRGGSNEPENVQLAHLHCNIKKNNRVDYVHA